MSNFFTRTGDDGLTGRLGEGRVPKDHPMTQAVGALDEASASLGLARSFCQMEITAAVLLRIQKDIYHMMAEVSATPENAPRFRVIDSKRVLWLEEHIEMFSESVEMPRDFIIPGDSRSGAFLALARTVVRRAERWIAGLLRDGSIENPELLRYINRVSSLCFVMELFEYQLAGMMTPTLAKDKS
jgi:cob(I)alamin adenosyltransferase